MRSLPAVLRSPLPIRVPRGAAWQATAVVLVAVYALSVATHAGVTGVGAVPVFLRITAVCLLLFGVCGLGVTRLALPQDLRAHEWLWVLPVGAVTTAFAMTPLGFLGVPYRVNLGLTLIAGAGLTVLAVRRRGLPARPRLAAVGWPVYLAAMLLAIVLVPLFRSGFATVIGPGSDAHLAAGTAEFLKHARPGSVDVALPVDRVPLVWRSKPPIYYALAAVSSLSGLQTYEVLSVLCALLLTLAAVGWFVFAREVLSASAGAAAVAMFLAGLVRMVVHTGIHPYFNQTWGYMTVPLTIVLAWSAVRRPAGGTIALLALFMAVCAFAYPLALPIPAVIVAVMWLTSQRGLAPLRGWLRVAPRWALAGLVVLAVLLVVPLYGVWEKVDGGLRILIDANYSLQAWGGDLSTWYPEREFFGIHSGPVWVVALPVIAAFALRELWRLARPVRFALLAIIVAGALVAVDMRLRDFGWYFHFKMLAFVGPLVVVLAAVALTRIRRGVGAVLLAVWVLWAAAEARVEIVETYDQLPRTVLALRTWSADLPPGASVRLDMDPPAQLWPAYLLARQRVCSERPLLNTSYPHVAVSRAADYVLVRYRPRPPDAVGAPVRGNREFQLYRLRGGLPGGDRCSQRMVQTVTRIERG